MARSLRKRHFAAMIVLVELAMISLFIYSLYARRWTALTWTLATATAIPSWLIALEAPSSCGVQTRKGYPCPNFTNGIIFGCAQAEGHLWAKFLARLGWHRQTLPLQTLAGSGTHEARAAGLHKPANKAAAVDVRIVEDRKSRITFWLAVVSTIAGVVSAIIEVTG